jgi:hypothetical protein
LLVRNACLELISRSGGASANEHADTTSPGVNGRAGEGDGGDTTNLVHGSDDAGSNSVVLDTEKVLEATVGQKRSEERTVVSVGSRAAKSDQDGEQQVRVAEQLGRLLDHGRLEGLVADGLLGGDDILRLDLVDIPGVLLIVGVRHVDGWWLCARKAKSAARGVDGGTRQGSLTADEGPTL